jgi:hypothetical protein
MVKIYNDEIHFSKKKSPFTKNEHKSHFLERLGLEKCEYAKNFKLRNNLRLEKFDFFQLI